MSHDYKTVFIEMNLDSKYVSLKYSSVHGKLMSLFYFD